MGPAPGQYDAKILGRSKSPIAYSIQGKANKWCYDPSDDQRQSPGPDRYNLNDRLTKAMRFIQDYRGDMSSSKYSEGKSPSRFGNPAEPSPGPGEYEVYTVAPSI